MPLLYDKVALVTGAGRGTGQAIALALGRAGARIVVVDVNPDSAQRAADAITQSGGLASVQVADVANKMGVQTMLYAVIEQWGRIDILVNAAQVTPSRAALEMDEWEWNRALDVNLKGAFLVAQTVARAMKETGGGLILNILRPAGATPHAAVRAAHEGLLGLTAALAAEWSGFGVRVELVAAEEPDRTADEVVERCGRLMADQ